LEVRQTLDVIQTLPNPFNQSVIKKGLTSLDKAFFNTLVMDCIECDKCKLWGKLQVAGLGTALKYFSLPNTEVKIGTPITYCQEMKAILN